MAWVILIFIERVVVRVSRVRALVVVDAIIFSVVFKYISIYVCNIITILLLCRILLSLFF